MKLLPLLSLLLSLFATGASAQKTIRLQNLWETPRVHVHYDGYTISFKIRDFDRTLAILTRHGITAYGTSSGLDTTRHYHFSLYPDNNMQYHNSLEQITQNVLGPFILLKGRAHIQKGKRTELKEIIADVAPKYFDDSVTYVNFFDPSNNKLIFSGAIATEMIHEDLGLDLPGY